MRLWDEDSISIPPDGLPQENQPKWRQDFPIDIPQDEYVSRRDFTRYMVLISFAFVVGQAWIVLQNSLRRRKGKQLSVKEIGRVDEMEIGQARTFEYPERHNACVLVRTGMRDFIAYSQVCTHLSCPVIPDPGKGVFRCPCHEGMFEMSTGTPLAGPPQRPLPKILLQITGNKIYAVGIEAPV